jgi:hypothetical protein
MLTAAHDAPPFFYVRRLSFGSDRLFIRRPQLLTLHILLMRLANKTQRSWIQLLAKLIQSRFHKRTAF